MRSINKILLIFFVLLIVSVTQARLENTQHLFPLYHHLLPANIGASLMLGKHGNVTLAIQWKRQTIQDPPNLPPCVVLRIHYKRIYVMGMCEAQMLTFSVTQISVDISCNHILYCHQIRVSLIKKNIKPMIRICLGRICRGIKSIAIDMIDDTSRYELYIRFQLRACRRTHFKLGGKMANTKSRM